MARGSSRTKIDEWTQRLFRFQKSGVTVVQFCLAEGVSPPSFYQWRKKLQDRRPPTRSSKSQYAPSGKRINKRPPFKVVQVTSSSKHDASGPALTVCMPGGIHVQVADNLPAIGVVVRELISAEKTDSGAEPC